MMIMTDTKSFEAKAEQAAGLLKIMSNEKRLMILCQLGGGEKSVFELQLIIGLSQSALSQHLAKLRAQNIVQTRKEAQTVFYSIKDEAVLRVIETLASIYCPELLQ